MGGNHADVIFCAGNDSVFTFLQGVIDEVVELLSLIHISAIPDMFAQQIKVTGKVTDSTNEGMPGVNVQVKGTATGTITDFDGNYSIDVPDSKSTLVFSFIGYVTQQVPVGGKKVLNVQLKDDTQTLDEVVVVCLFYTSTTVRKAGSAINSS